MWVTWFYIALLILTIGCVHKDRLALFGALGLLGWCAAANVLYQYGVVEIKDTTLVTLAYSFYISCLLSLTQRAFFALLLIPALCVFYWSLTSSASVDPGLFKLVNNRIFDGGILTVWAHFFFTQYRPFLLSR